MLTFTKIREFLFTNVTILCQIDEDELRLVVFQCLSRGERHFWLLSFCYLKTTQNAWSEDVQAATQP